MVTENSFQPDWISTPGATILDVLRQQGLSLEKFAALMGYSKEHAFKLLHGKVSITREIAKGLERNIGGSADFWASRESQYRDDVARLQSRGSSNAARAWLNELPVNDMIKLGWLDRVSSVDEKVKACLSFFDVPDVVAWRHKYRNIIQAVRFRTSATFGSEPGAVLAWLRHAEMRSAAIRTKPWHAQKFKANLMSARQLTRKKDPNSFVGDLQKLCAEGGVRLVIARAPSGCRASGATQFISPNRPMMLLSLRYLSDDQFWFSFFHEAGHLLCHDHNAIFLEDDSEVTSEQEQEANDFAERMLIPSEYRSELSEMRITRENILRYAVKVGVSRGIVVGQLQHMNLIRSNQFNWLKRRYSWDQIVLS
jgi:HTH-type transcriptional regulator / antitoxin HigA